MDAASARQAQGLATMTPEMQGAERYYDWLAETLKPNVGRRVLEIGPGFGNLADRCAGVDLYLGLDNSEQVVAHLYRRFAGKPWFEALVDRTLGAEHRDVLRTRRIDTVIAVNVLEHLPDDAAALRLWAEIAPGAKLLVFVPALACLYGTLDAQAGHYRRYTREGLEGLLLSCGATVEKVAYFNAIGALGWFISGRILKQDLGGPGARWMVKVYERWVLPVARLVDPILIPLWGQSVVAVCRLPG